MYTFDASALPNDAQNVSFRFTIPALRGIPSASPMQGATPVVRVVEPWTFSFDLPVAR